ncbi:hypothetical protein C8Q77DRAFT_1220429 [Trametes polyzona]|nr:hypothetical protein C8Q77DRAFT_1220429 [Trametes polyzona]
MSMNTHRTASQYIAVFQSLFIDNCCGIAISAFLGFEYFLTLDREVELFWKRKFTGASALFLSNRYLPLLTIILEMCQSTPMSDRVCIGLAHVVHLECDVSFSCTMFVKMTSVVSVLQYFPWAAFSTLRAFALSRRQWPVTLLILAFSVAPIIINYARYHWLTAANDPLFGCINRSELPGDLARRMLLLLNSLQLVFSMLSVYETFVDVSYVTIFTESVTAVLVSRFLMDLQETNKAASEGDYRTQLSTGSWVSDVHFAPIIGTLGSTVTQDDTEIPTDEVPE